MCESSKREGFPDRQNLLAVFFMAEERIAGSVRSCAIRWGEGLDRCVRGDRV